MARKDPKNMDANSDDFLIAMGLNGGVRQLRVHKIGSYRRHNSSGIGLQSQLSTVAIAQVSQPRKIVHDAVEGATHDLAPGRRTDF